MELFIGPEPAAIRVGQLWLSNHSLTLCIQDTPSKLYLTIPTLAVVEALDDLPYASLETDMTGDDNDLVFTAKVPGTTGNSLTIALVDPEEETAEESIDVTDPDIIVTLRSVSSVLSTAAQVKAALEADEDAMALIGVEFAADNDGTGVVTELSETALAGGGVDGLVEETQQAIIKQLRKAGIIS